MIYALSANLRKIKNLPKIGTQDWDALQPSKCTNYLQKLNN